MMIFGNIGIVLIAEIVRCVQANIIDHFNRNPQACWVRHVETRQQGLLVSTVPECSTRLWDASTQKLTDMVSAGYLVVRTADADAKLQIVQNPTEQQMHATIKHYVDARIGEMQTFFESEGNNPVYSRIFNFRVSTIVNQVIRGSKTNIKNMQAHKLAILKQQADILKKQEEAVKQETRVLIGTWRSSNTKELKTFRQRVKLQPGFTANPEIAVAKDFDDITEFDYGNLQESQVAHASTIQSLNAQIKEQYQFVRYMQENSGQEFKTRTWWNFSRSLTLKEILFPDPKKKSVVSFDQLKDYMSRTLSKTMDVNGLTISDFHETVIEKGLKKNLQKCAEDRDKRNKIFKIVGGIGIVMALVALVVVSVLSAGTLALPVAAGVGLAVGVGIGVEKYLTDHPIKTAVHDAGMGATYISTPSPPQIL